MSGILIDTSAVYALMDTSDDEHDAAVEWLRSHGDASLVTHVTIVTEMTALLERRLGVSAANDFVDELLPTIAVFQGTELTSQRALAAYRAGTGRRRPSLTDRHAFETMRELELDAAFAFDEHFTSAGFAIVP